MGVTDAMPVVGRDITRVKHYGPGASDRVSTVYREHIFT